jgi:hypothetical protein
MFFDRYYLVVDVKQFTRRIDSGEMVRQDSAMRKGSAVGNEISCISVLLVVYCPAIRQMRTLMIA